MARWRFAVGEFFETITKPEMADVLREDRAAAAVQAEQRAAAHARKYMRLTPPLTGQAVSGKLSMGGDFVTGPAASGGASVGGQAGIPSLQPRAGYAWAIRRASVRGLTNGTTPDVVNLFRRQSDANAWQAGPATVSGGDWQFNGNNFAYTFSHEQIVFLEGETPILVSQGTFNATGLIALYMDFVEVPELELYRAR